jgi:hypothetical protein
MHTKFNKNSSLKKPLKRHGRICQSDVKIVVKVMRWGYATGVTHLRLMSAGGHFQMQ